MAQNPFKTGIPGNPPPGCEKAAQDLRGLFPSQTVKRVETPVLSRLNPPFLTKSS